MQINSKKLRNTASFFNGYQMTEEFKQTFSELMASCSSEDDNELRAIVAELLLDFSEKEERT